MRPRKPQRKERDRFCYFCLNGIPEIDYKDVNTIQKFTSNYQKILPRKRMGCCARHQRQLGTAVKRARLMALIPYTTGQK
ncbi:MAG: 30S ribosomal protein S18 [Candidatus Kerfeldbacteria bacterium]